ncbi:MAG TPA: signal peptidase I [Phycisphaerales bacterium]|nr:signal peptidase I [Phycisphaerales bacterium]
MNETNDNSQNSDARKDRAAEIANTFEWLITAFILAFVFRAFVMEAFRIPTGSMADTLKGAHFRLRCPQCGYPYDYGFVPGSYGYSEDYIPVNANLRRFPSRCPSCGFYQATGGTMPVSNGDRILVLKCIYQFMEPRRWDVIVFKNPLDPRINYIKRLVALPDETIEIIDGDVYINNEIQRKPPKVQEELWMVVYDNDYQPARPLEGSFNGHTWKQPFANADGGLWLDDPNHPILFHLDAPVDRLNRLVYDASVGNDFTAAYAYNSVRDYTARPYCSDLMVRYDVLPRAAEGVVGAALTKYGIEYRAMVDFSGRMRLVRLDNDGETLLAEKSIRAVRCDGRPLRFRFANVDHRLVMEFAGDELAFDMGLSADAAGPRRPSIRPRAEILGAGRLTLLHVAIFRDIHYTGSKYGSGPDGGRAIEGEPFTLEADQFFVLGDNSPNSEDARWWSEPGLANRGQTYRMGVVPRDYLVGKALFVYWPGGFKPFPSARFAAVPNVGQMRFIYGGSRNAD